MRWSRFLYLILLLVVLFVGIVSAQTTEFTYQGSLKDNSAPANSNYDFEFALFDAASGGNQIGATITKTNVSVANGIFSVKLDFGAVFPGANRFMEMRVRLTGQPGITTLTPRQLVNSSPYSVKSINSDNTVQLGGVAANQYVVTTDSRLSDPRPPTAGSTNYVQNGVAQQSSSNFNVSGNGTAGGTLSGGVVNAATQFNLNGNRILSASASNNTFAGLGAGIVNTGANNSFFGTNAGTVNTNGTINAFFGSLAGAANTSGSINSFFGAGAGQANTTTSGNSFFGSLSGQNNVGDNNTFFGAQAGQSNTTGDSNTFIGAGAGGLSPDLINATAIGANAKVSGNLALVLGDDNVRVGIGTTNPNRKLEVVHGGGNGILVRSTSSYSVIDIEAANGDAGIRFNDAGVSRWDFRNNPADNSFQFFDQVGMAERMRINPNGTIVINTLGAAGATTLCRNASNQISTCSSSLRYKTNIGQFSSGLAFVNRLRPISFDWKDSGMKDVGFGAEDIAKIDPRFVTYNDKGEVEGVKYDRLSVAFVNAFKEQQVQIDTQQTLIDELREKSVESQNQVEVQQKLLDRQQEELQKQRIEIDALKTVLCVNNPLVGICKEN